jgi:hypothetical protein
MTDNSNNRKPLFSTLETKPSNPNRLQTPRPEPIDADSDKS